MTEIISRVFPTFSQKHITFEKHGEISQESIDLFLSKSLKPVLPEMLVEFWEEYGESFFSDGLLYICDPVKKRGLLDFFFPESASPLYPIVISSFGDIFFTDFEKVYYLSASRGWFSRKANDIELLFEISLKGDDILGGVLRSNLHFESVKKLGRLNNGEIFGFEPALALGGAEEIKYVKKFQMDAHLAFLSQLVQVEER
jgi:hypothetical protein